MHLDPNKLLGMMTFEFFLFAVFKNYWKIQLHKTKYCSSKVEKSSEDSLDFTLSSLDSISLPSTSVKIEIIGRKVYFK